jgi:hypothetical protein
MKMDSTDYSVTFRMATEADRHLETYDHTKLSAINTCPTWGILRYQMHKRMPGAGRALALELGSTMHECFAFIRLVGLLKNMQDEGRDKQFIDVAWAHHGSRLFGIERLTQISDAIADAEDEIDVCRRGCVCVLDTSGYYDDPRDKRRTLNNAEECIYAYINRWRWDHPVWRRDADVPTSDVGIEIPFDVVVDITGMVVLSFRLTGRIDGIHLNSRNQLTIHDNKTASRLNESWSMSQAINHQYTGYCVAASVFTQQVVNHGEIIGLAVPLPKAYDFGSFIREPITRFDHHYKRWVDWLVHTVNLTQQHSGDPYAAPKYTHSCNRYFRPCAFIPFCDADDEEQHIIVGEMETQEWSPLAKTVLDGVGDE